MKPTLPVLPDGFADHVVGNFGKVQQDFVLVTECSKLQTAICDYRRSEMNRVKPLTHDDEENIIETMAHVLVSMQIVMHTHGISHYEIQNAFNAKIREDSGRIK